MQDVMSLSQELAPQSNQNFFNRLYGKILMNLKQ